MRVVAFFASARYSPHHAEPRLARDQPHRDLAGHDQGRRRKQRREVVLDPRGRAHGRFVGAGFVVEEPDGQEGAVAAVDQSVGDETRNRLDDWHAAFDDPPDHVVFLVRINFVPGV